MSNIPITIHIDSGQEIAKLAHEVADQIEKALREVATTVEGITSHTHHTVTDVKVGKAK